MGELLDRLRGKAPCNGSELQEAADRIAELEPFKTRLLESLIVSHIYASEHETDANKAVHDLIGWEVKVALDPQVSSDAEALIQKGRNESKDRIAELEKKVASFKEELQYHFGSSDCECYPWEDD